MCIDLDYYSSYSYALYYSWYRHGTVLLGHAVVDATEVWLDPTDNRAHNRVVSTDTTTRHRVIKLPICQMPLLLYGLTVACVECRTVRLARLGERQAESL